MIWKIRKEHEVVYGWADLTKDQVKNFEKKMVSSSLTITFNRLNSQLDIAEKKISDLTCM